jgi:hypothetical protein
MFPWRKRYEEGPSDWSSRRPDCRRRIHRFSHCAEQGRPREPRRNDRQSNCRSNGPYQDRFAPHARAGEELARFRDRLARHWQNSADRPVAFRAERGQQKESDDVIEYLQSHAKFLGERSADVKKLADAAQPLYASLDEHQKRRFANELIRLSRERDIDERDRDR